VHQLETGKRRLPWAARYLDPFDACRARAAPAVLREALAGGGVALHLCFHRAIIAIAHPTGESQASGFALERIPIPHSLDDSVDAQLYGGHGNYQSVFEKADAAVPCAK